MVQENLVRQVQATWASVPSFLQDSDYCRKGVRRLWGRQWFIMGILQRMLVCGDAFTHLE